MTLTGKKMSVLNYVAEVFFIQNYFPGVWFHTWSLAVEEHFYFTLVIIASLLIVCKVRFNLRSMIIACIILSLFFLGFRMASWLERPGLFGTHFVATHLRMDSLLGGVLLAALHRYRPVAFLQFFRNHRWLLVFGIVLLLLPTLLEPFGSFIMITFGLSGVYLAGTLALVSRTLGSTDGATVRVLYAMRLCLAVGGQGFILRGLLPMPRRGREHTQ